MTSYYREHLSAERLRRCYEIAPSRVKRHLAAEIDHVLDRLHPRDSILDLGCGYGRVLLSLQNRAETVTGIDTSEESLRLARTLLGADSTCALHVMDATDLDFPDDAFDQVMCIQNGICASNVDQRRLIDEAMRVTRDGGTVHLSTYSDRFWDDRLAWFRLQARHGLIGEIDEKGTGDGVIACVDGFRASRLTRDDFRRLTAHLHVEPIFHEVDDSSLFCELGVSKRRGQATEYRQ